MKWSIPAKTFLLGEYAALADSSAIILTTSPCFELTLSQNPGLMEIHPESPAGIFWTQQGHADVGLQWHDPYQGRGGLGASSAQFVGAYLASMHLKKEEAHHQGMLKAYWRCATPGIGLRPSGYDVIAQSLSGCVYINRKKNLCRADPWPFQDIGFLLLHTGQKLATHHHLQAMPPLLLDPINRLSAIVDTAEEALLQVDSHQMIKAVQAYHEALAHMDLVAEHSLEHIDFFKHQPNILAVKGCGAMGADVLLLLTPALKLNAMRHQLSAMGWGILATNLDLYQGNELMPTGIH